jgi:diguanylate cyclase (GGDEF)-like protein
VRSWAPRRTTRDNDIRRFSAEFDDFLLERRFWAETGDEQAHWGRLAALIAGMVAIPLCVVDLAVLGFGPRFLVLLLIRTLSTVPPLALYHLLTQDPTAIRRHGLITASCAGLLVCYASLTLLQPDLANLDHLEMGIVLVAMFTIVPNRLVYMTALGVVASAAWVGATALVRDTTGPAILAQSVAFGVVVLLGYVSGNMVGTTRRQEYALRLSAELANERLRAEISRRERLERDLVERANTDPLTKIANRRHFEEQAADEFRRCQRNHQPLSLMVIDVDHFKWINDTHGHAAGDEVLRVLSEALSEQVRRIDVVGRLGGEEFAVVMPGADKARAEEAAERLRARISGLRVELATGPVRMTVSIGVTECDVWTEQLPGALSRADDAMYQAKAGGRDRVVMS